MTEPSFKELFTEIIPALCERDFSEIERGPDFGIYALPHRTLELLVHLNQILGSPPVLEMGTGASTHRFLSEGIRVLSIEDSVEWLDKVRARIPQENLTNHTTLVRPFETVFDGAAPFLSWTVDTTMKSHIQSCGMIIIDFSLQGPSREHMLLECLNLTKNQLIVFDDSSTRPAKRFCDRIARVNPHLLYHRTSIDHGLAFFMRTCDKSVFSGRGGIETIKAWRRYFQAVQMYRNYKPVPLKS